MFFAYLRSLSPDSVAGKNGISALPLSLQALLHNTEYPPGAQTRITMPTSKVVMVVDVVSPTPFALLRRAKHFEYRDDDRVLQEFSDYEDPIQALTDECRRVLRSISSANDSSTTKTSTSLGNASWSRFEDVGFGALGDESDHDDEADGSALQGQRKVSRGLQSNAQSKSNDLGRPTTPSWADFLSSGFVDESKQGRGYLLPPDKVLPPINTRGQSSQSHRRMTDDDSLLEPGELANITHFNLDDAFWWAWISSLSGEETSERKAAFGRCSLIETFIQGNNWLVMEEIVKGAAPDPAEGAYIAEKKKSIFSFGKRSRLGRSKSNAKKTKPPEPMTQQPQSVSQSKASIAPDQHARIQAAAAALQQRQQSQQEIESSSPRRARQNDTNSTKTNSVFTLQPVIMSEAAPAMKWASSYDKNTIRTQYLGDNFAGKGLPVNTSQDAIQATHPQANGAASPPPPPKDTSMSPEPRDPSGYTKPDSRLMDVMKQGPGLTPAPLLSRKRSQISTHQETITEEDTVQLSQTPSLGADVVQNHDNVAAAAVRVPLPASTPSEMSQRQESMPSQPIVHEYPQPMERSAVPPLQQREPPLTPKDPNSFSAGPDYSQYNAPKPSTAEPPSPETAKSAQRKLKKKTGQSGIKGFFGRKKPEAVEPVPQSTSAVAAARAALEAKQRETVPPPAPKDVKQSRRISNFGRRDPASSALAAPMPAIEEPKALPVEPATSSHSFARTEPPYRPNDSQASLSRVDSNEQRQADREFRTFDQGPLEDAPAYMDDPSARESMVTDTDTLTAGERDIDHEFAPGPGPALHRDPVESAMPHMDAGEPDTDEPLPVQDRWAQIRKNAAERAARMNEEQSSSKLTDRTTGTEDTEDGDGESEFF